MKIFHRKIRRGERGFTLLELLVVVAILGVLAAVVIPNVGRFIGSSAEEAANTELHDVQTAVIAAMSEENVGTLNAGGVVRPFTAGDVIADTEPIGSASTVQYNVTVGGVVTTYNLNVQTSILGNLQATYTIGTDGAVISATPDPNGKFKTLTFSNGTWS